MAYAEGKRIWRTRGNVTSPDAPLTAGDLVWLVHRRQAAGRYSYGAVSATVEAVLPGTRVRVRAHRETGAVVFLDPRFTYSTREAAQAAAQAAALEAVNADALEIRAREGAPVGRCLGCRHDFATGPCGGCGCAQEFATVDPGNAPWDGS